VRQVVTISVQSFSFLLMLPVLTMGIGMWLMGLTSSSARCERKERSDDEEATSTFENHGTLPEARWRQSRGKLKLT
jgi:hypothetical protein